MAISTPTDVGKNTPAAGAASTVTFTTTAIVASGGKILLAVGWFHATTVLSSVSATGCSGGIVKQQVNGSDHYAVAYLDCPNGLASASTVTATFSAATADSRYISGAQVTGAEPGPGYGAVGQSQTATAWSSTATTVQNGDLLFGGSYSAGTNSTNTASGGNTELHDFAIVGDSSMTDCYQAGTGAAIAAQGTWTNSNPVANAAVALAAIDAGPLSPATATGWTNPGNVVSSNASYATTAIPLLSVSPTLDVSNFGFSVPSTATILGIIVEVEKHFEVVTVGKDWSVRLQKGGTPVGGSRADTTTGWVAADPNTYVTYGGGYDLWGTTWTAADVNDAGFGVEFYAQNTSPTTTRTASVDHIRIYVFYDDPGSGIPQVTRGTPDFQRKGFPFIIGDSRMEGVARAGARWRVGGRSGPSPINGFERFIFPRLHQVYQVGGATFPQALDATVTSIASFVNQVGKNVTATATSTATFVKQVGKAVTATATSTATIVKRVGKAVTANATSTASILPTTAFGKALTATVTSTATIVRQVGKPVTATVTSTATMLRQVGKALTATVTSTATLLPQKGILKTMTATVTSTASIVKQIGKPLTATATATASIVKRVGKVVTATVTSTAAILPQKGILKTMTATVTSTATLVKQVGKPLSAAVTSTASIVKHVGKSLTATATSSATIGAIKGILKTMTATVTSTATMVRRVGKPLTGLSSASASLVKQVGKRVQANATVSASLTALRVFLKAMTATVTSTATMSRRVGKNVTATVTSTATLAKQIGKTLVAGVSVIGSFLASLPGNIVNWLQHTDANWNQDSSTDWTQSAGTDWDQDAADNWPEDTDDNW